ncbi:putative MFS transporter [Aspergillus tanneri]|uniref:Uncharacterized protein n=1 Tax=Aspergillus tanneri TaxID=1220188 RepID=A0A5M9MJK0_9EURO|nr:uncharacterized protein ATNIH1004_005875 [Aspergillus tanneri]KAA8647185.1 hypothetical protein ATNIH1004_005875 [Aspergillus tanneri]
MFPGYRFTGNSSTDAPITEPTPDTQNVSQKESTTEAPLPGTLSQGVCEIDIPPRTYRQKIDLVHYFKDGQTTRFQYFRRLFYVFVFPNIVLIGIQSSAAPRGLFPSTPFPKS